LSTLQNNVKVTAESNVYYKGMELSAHIFIVKFVNENLISSAKKCTSVISLDFITQIVKKNEGVAIN